MPLCTRKGCGKEFEEEGNEEGSCVYHPGGPVFHEGLKSWSCCNEVNKPVMEFEAFMSIPPCTKGKHTTESIISNPPAVKPQTDVPTIVKNGNSNGVGIEIETYTTSTSIPIPSSSTLTTTNSSSTLTTTTPSSIPAKGIEIETEEDDLSLPVPEGTRCKRTTCGAIWEGEEISRGNGIKSKCKYHPQPPIFHEGSKGYLCCKRRVLEFDEFMKIQGCTEGNHLFVGSDKGEKEERVECRLDHYQTPMQVHVSAFAKGADKNKSKVTFETQQLHLDLFLPGNKRVVKSVTLYGPVDPTTSTFRILSTKVDIILQKPAPASWPLLELPPPGTELPPGYALTFGVSGRTGTIGGKDFVLAPEELARRQ
ncbi:CORD and CS domain-containing protein [Tremella mesenterica]|uniref:CORD and CS domain-containing protein n=1 Tax=Tremella mesenterica TaxID=5217 RepID=A0A4Q1BRF0_TREME|nr:uncharacterized protein TREMEDRAFT_45668 [Tremella mesenterica DSM 1558]EIW66535.1 hypothetical protein TREMEDRAFT_45668 [Tremella mesenterica DSM 1558]RXK40452.1 CORD and CS domain-containing protein [Tremella mesenterica]